MTSTTRASDLSYFDFMEFFSADTTTFVEDEMQNMWTWAAEPQGLPPIHEPLLINTNRCKFSTKCPRHQKMFRGHNFKIGGHKE